MVPEIDPAATYRVVLRKPVEVGGIKLKPMGTHRMRGAALATVISTHGEGAIDDVQPADG